MAYGYAPSPPPKKSNTGLIIGLVLGGVVLVVGGIAVLLVVWLLGIGSSPSSTAAEPAPADAAAPDTTDVPAGFDGVWSGDLEQTDPQGASVADFELNLHLTEGASIASGFLYNPDGSVMCDWVADIEDASPDHLYGTYEVTSDPDDNCVTEGELWVDYNAGALDVLIEVEWTGEGTSQSEGELFLS